MAKAAAADRVADVIPQLIDLKDLHLDPQNPRFAEAIGKNPSEKDIVEHLVEVHGVDDVLSSIGVNNYFGNEPLLAVQPTKSAPIIVVEGNRRFVACLILAGDLRAADHFRRRAPFEGMKGYGIQKVPVAIYKSRDDVVAYLGSKHIAGAQPWDAYAKAAWVAHVLETNKDLTLELITKMTGDQHRTVARLLEGYYFIQQLEKTGRFRPENSIRKGRRSSAQFPFSWVYTILGYTNAREWLEIESANGPGKDPVPEGQLDRAEELIDFMFGNKARSKNPVVGDSRQLQDLAKAVTMDSVYQQIRKGIPLDLALEAEKSSSDQIGTNLYTANESLKKIQVILGDRELPEDEARTLEPMSGEVRRRAIQVNKEIIEDMNPEVEE